MVRLIRNVLLTVALLAAMLPGTSLPAAAGAPTAPDSPRLLQAEGSSLVFELAVPLPQVDQVMAEGRTFQRLSLPGYEAVGEPGQPELLQRGITVGIPPQGDLSVRVIDSVTEDLPGNYTLYPVPATTVSYDPETNQPDPFAGVQEQFVEDPAAYAVDRFEPDAVVSVDEIGYLRQQRVARIVVRPVQYNPAAGTVRATTYLKVEITFAGGDIQRAVEEAPDAFEPLLQNQLLNYQQARRWRAPRENDRAPAIPDVYPGDTSRVWFKVSLSHSGLYKITPFDLQAPELAPLANADPSMLQLWRDGQQLPMYFQGDGNAQFEAGERLVFYAQVEPTVYSETNVYWLSVGVQPGLRMGTANASPGPSGVETSFAASAHLESDFLFRNDLPGSGTPDYPRWYWTELHSLFSPTRTVYAALPGAVTTGYTASLRVRFFGSTDLAANPDHHIQAYVNDHAVGDLTWNGATEAIGEFQFPASNLVAGLNAIRLDVPGDLPNAALDQSYLDWLEVEYRAASAARNDLYSFMAEGAGRHEFRVGGFTGQNMLAFDVSDPASPRRLAGTQVEVGEGGGLDQPVVAGTAATTQDHRTFLPTMGGSASGTAGPFALRFGLTQSGSSSYAVGRPESMERVGTIIRDNGSDLRASTNRADYLLITYAGFADAAQALAAHRRSGGLRVAKVDVQDIYDEFSNGQMDPGAIRDFVSYAYHYWQSPAPAYVLLLGGGNYDYRMTTGLTSIPNFVPPYYSCFDPWVCEVASDNEYVAVSGNDRLPDLGLGRLPAETPESAMRMVNKIIGYEDSPPSGDWRSFITCVADNNRDPNGQPDPAGDFEALCEGVIAQLPAAYTAERIFYDPYPDDDGGEPYRYRTQPEATQAIVDSVTAGKLFVNFIGHASTTTWAHERLLRARSDGRNDVTQMLNGPRLPVFLDMACLSGNFADAVYPSIQATLLDWDAGGSVGGWAATGFGVATGHDRLHHGFYASWTSGGVQELGPATVAGKLELWQSGTNLDLLDTFGLLGDPALHLDLVPTAQ